jgi:MFS family permease
VKCLGGINNLLPRIARRRIHIRGDGDEKCTDRVGSRAEAGSRLFPCLARLAAPELPLVFQWAEYLAYRYVDDADRHVVAGIPADEVASDAGHRWVCGTDSDLFAGSTGWCAGGPRVDRRSVLVWTQAVAMVQSLLLAVLTLTHRITIAEVLALSVLQGVVNAFDMPGRQSFMIEMVGDREDLSNAIAINSSMVNLARLVGPALAGLLIAATNEGWCFGVDGVSYLAVIASLLMMRITPVAREKTSASMLEQLREGWSYVAGFAPIRTILLLFALVSLMGWPFMVLMPVFAAQVLHGGPHTLGFLMGAVGVGSLVSALLLVVRKSVRGLTRVIPMAGVIFRVGLILFGLSHAMWFSMMMMLFTGYGMMQAVTASNTIIQTLVDGGMRGRVMSFYTMAFVGMAPFGSLLAGTLAHLIGVQRTVMFSGTMVLIGSVWFVTRLKAIRKEMRPVYERLGIVPPRDFAEPEVLSPPEQ